MVEVGEPKVVADARVWVESVVYEKSLYAGIWLQNTAPLWQMRECGAALTQ